MFNIMLLKRDLLLAKALLKPEFGQLLSKSASWWLPAFLVFLLHLDLMYMILGINIQICKLIITFREKCDHPPLCYDLSATDRLLARDDV